VSLLGLLILLVVIGFCLWLVTTYVPMAPPIKAIIVAVVVLVLVIYLLQATGLLSGQPLRLR
jgi:hypothetical protein